MARVSWGRSLPAATRDARYSLMRRTPSRWARSTRSATAGLVGASRTITCRSGRCSRTIAPRPPPHLEQHLPGRPVPVGRGEAPQLRQEVVALERRAEEVLLGAEVVVEQALRDAGGLGQVLHRGRVEPFGGEDRQRRVDQLAPARLGLLAAGRPDFVH